MATWKLRDKQIETLRVLVEASPKGTDEVHQSSAKALALRGLAVELTTEVEGARGKKTTEHAGWKATANGKKLLAIVSEAPAA